MVRHGFKQAVAIFAFILLGATFVDQCASTTHNGEHPLSLLVPALVCFALALLAAHQRPPSGGS